MVSIEGSYYPNLVHQFYTNITNKKTSGLFTIESYVKGVQIVLDRPLMERLLDVPNEGPMMHMVDKFPRSNSLWNWEEAITRLGLKWMRKVGTIKILAKHFTAHAKLLHYILNHNIAPKASGFNEVRQDDVYILDKMIHDLGGMVGIPLSPIIINEMRDIVRTDRKKKALCFPFLLTRIFVHFGVDLTNEEAVPSSGAELVSVETLYHQKYFRVNGRWRNIDLYPLRKGEKIDSRGGLTDDTTENKNGENVNEMSQTEEEFHMEDVNGSEIEGSSISDSLTISSDSSSSEQGALLGNRVISYLKKMYRSLRKGQKRLEKMIQRLERGHG